MGRHAKAPSARPTASKGETRARKAKLGIAGAFLTALATLTLGATLASAVAPTVTIEDAAGVEFSTAGVKGEVNPEGQATEWRFQYITDSQFEGNVANALPGFEGSSTGPEGTTEATEAVQGQLTGLQPETTYHLRLIAANGDGQGEAVATSAFTTKGPVTAPVVNDVEASEALYTTAKASGKVEVADADPAFNAPCHFQYVAEDQLQDNLNNGAPAFEGALSQACDVTPVGPGSTDVEAQLTALAPNTTYHLRLLAANAGGQGEALAASTFETLPVAKPSVTTPIVSAITDSAAHFSGSVGPNSPEAPPVSAAVEAAFTTTYRFSCSPACPGLQGDRVLAADQDSHEVSDESTALEPSTAYQVTLSASNAGGERSRSESFETASVPPDVTTFPFLGPLGDTTVQLNGTVNPHNSPATYWFEYGAEDCSANPCAAAPATALDGAETTNAAIQVSHELSGLSPDTTYHFRLIADNGTGGPIPGADHVFTTHPTPPPPAGPCPNEAVRLQQHSTFLPECRAYELVSPANKNSSVIFNGAIAPDGGRVVITAGGGLDGGGVNSPTFGVRNPDGSWDTRSLLPPSEQRPYPNYALTAFNGAFTRFFAESTSSVMGAGPAVAVSIDDHAHQTIRASFSPEIGGTSLNMAGSDDLTKVYANVRDPIDPGHVGNTSNVYDVAQDPPLLVSRLPNGSVPACGVYENLPGFARSVAGDTSAQRWVSSDGNHIFFLSSGNGPCDFSANPPALYRRDLDTDTTTLISGPPLNTPKAFTSFLQASADGSAAFFATPDALTADDLDASGDIYRWDEPNTLTCITCAAPFEVAESGGVYDDTVAVSQDLSHAYFRSGNSIYVWHVTQASGPAGAIDQIASGLQGLIRVINNPVSGGQLTPDGNVLLYTVGPNGQPQLYRYDDRDGSSRCLSCPEGGPPASHAALPSARIAGTAYVRVMSDDGSRVFFNSGDHLIPGDPDSKGIYEWRDDGSTRGEYGLISEDGNLLNVSADGSTVLFKSYSHLTPDVADTSNQAYVARIGGGKLQPEPPAPPCAGDACQGAPSVAPAEPSAASAAFIGPPSPKTRHRHKAKKNRKHRKHNRHSDRRASNHDRRAHR